MKRSQLLAAEGDRILEAMALERSLGLPADTPPAEALLYARYVRALALLCECAPYVDEEEYGELIEELLADACTSYPLAWRRLGGRYEIAPSPSSSVEKPDSAERHGGPP
jgi:hypothetical protein